MSGSTRPSNSEAFRLSDDCVGYIWQIADQWYGLLEIDLGEFVTRWDAFMAAKNEYRAIDRTAAQKPIRARK